MEDKLIIIMPAYNESECIAEVVKEWHEAVVMTGPESLLAVFNDGSKDNTLSILTELKKELPQLEIIDKKNSGHGSTCIYGYRWALDHGADWIFQTDSDGQTDPKEFPAFWKRRKQHAVLMGRRPHRKDGIGRIIVSRGLCLVLRIIYGVTIIDSNVPFRLMRRDVLERNLDKVPKDSFLCNVMLSIVLFHEKEDVVFYPISFKPRNGGASFINIKSIARIAKKTVRDCVQLKKTLRKGD